MGEVVEEELGEGRGLQSAIPRLCRVGWDGGPALTRQDRGRHVTMRVTCFCSGEGKIWP